MINVKSLVVDEFQNNDSVLFHMANRYENNN
jgi:hypothetical protein